MFSLFRNHRNGSSPSSPRSPRPSPYATSPALDHWESPRFNSNPSFQAESSSVRAETPISNLPPVLPPIPRVASQRASTHTDDAKPRAGIGAKQPQDSNHERPQSLWQPTSRRRTSLSPHNDSRKLPPIPIITSDDENDDDRNSKPPPISKDLDVARSKHQSWMPQSATSPTATTGYRRLLPEHRNVDVVPDRREDSRSANAQVPGSRLPRSLTTNSHIDPSMNRSLPLRSSSPASSFSSYARPTSSTNMAGESSPASSKSTYATPANIPPPRSAKAKFNLLNPVHLLMRRRASHGNESPQDAPVARPRTTMESPAMTVPDDYDPRIRGPGVHDFSAPRPRPSHSTTDVHGLGLQATAGAEESGTRQNSDPGASLSKDSTDGDAGKGLEREHVPVFVENFDDESTAADSSSAIQRESLANSNFLARLSRQLDFGSPTFTSPTSQPKIIPEEPRPSSNHGQKNSKNIDESSVRISSDISTMRSSISNDTRATTPPHSPNKQQSRTSLTLEPPFQPGEGLKHLPSSASHVSRFSFQMNSDHSNAQEKALEEKHKQKAALKATDLASNRDSRFDDFDEEDIGDYDDIDDENLEEDIPLNDGGLGLGLPTGLNNLQPSTQAPGISAVMSNNQAAASGSQGFGLWQHQVNSPLQAGDDDRAGADTQMSMTSDDMYFDDGVIDHPLDSEESNLDESMFDTATRTTFGQQTVDENPSRPKTNPVPGFSETETTEDSTAGNEINEQDEDTITLPAVKEPEQPSEASIVTSYDRLQSGLDDEAVAKDPNTLNAYHSALASAASKAALDGKFQRHPSVAASSIYDEGRSDVATQRESFDDGNDDLLNRKFAPSDDDFDDDDGLGEDTMIAEANAEVLASEDSEFYGKEFGFYGNPSDGGMPLSYGGYFGNPLEDYSAHGPNGRNATREPNLTPITERSEFSARNSFISTNAFGPSSLGGRDQRGSSVGLKELANAGFDDDDMTLGQLLRLRKEAFGERGRSNSFGSSDQSPSSFSGSSPLVNRNSQSWQSAQHHQYGSSFDRSEECSSAVSAPDEDDGASVGSAPRPWSFQARGHSRRGSAEAYAREYTDAIEPNPHTSSVISPNTGYSHTMSGQSRPLSPLPESAPTSPRYSLPSPSAVPLPSSPPMPIPPSAMMHSLAQRPQVDPYRKSWQPQPPNKRGSASQDDLTLGTPSITYISEDTPEGEKRWYKESRRRLSSGETRIERELVQGGNI